MGAQRCNRLARGLSEAGVCRDLLGLLAILPLRSGLAAVLDFFGIEDKGRRTMRRKHGKVWDAGERRSNARASPRPRPRLVPESSADRSSTIAGRQPIAARECDSLCGECFICKAGPTMPGARVIDPEREGE